MVFSKIVAYFIILATGAPLFVAGKRTSPRHRRRSEPLRPLAGEPAPWSFAIGLVGSGVLAVPILTGSATYGRTEGVRLAIGLDRKPSQAHADSAS